MINYAVDLGSYSVKGLSYQIDKKRIKYLGHFETVLDKDRIDPEDEDGLLKLQLQAVVDHLIDVQEDYTLTLSAPTDLLTSRILQLPVNSRKKANMMLPFQLETDLPFAISSAHYASILDLHKTFTDAIVSIGRKEDIRSFVNHLKEYSLKPKVLTSDVSFVYSFIKNVKEPLPSCFAIMDFGHSSVKAYFFLENNLVSNHTCHIAGKSIDEAIAENYNVSMEEAAVYKHQNAFLLLEDQYNQVNDDQRKFAQLMDETFGAIIRDLKRWTIGLKVKYSKTLGEIYVVGGITNIKNFNLYLSNKIGVKVADLDFFADDKVSKLPSTPSFQKKFAIPAMVAKSTGSRPNPINLLSKDFALVPQDSLPVDRFVFLGTRVAILFFIILISVVAERFIVSSQLDEMDKKLVAILKNPAIEVNRSIKAQARKNPQSVLSRVKSSYKDIKQEVSLVQSSVNTNALRPLDQLARVVAELKEVELIQFESLSQGNFTAVFKYEKPEQLESLRSSFEAYAANLTTDSDASKKTFSVSGSDI